MPQDTTSRRPGRQRFRGTLVPSSGHGTTTGDTTSRKVWRRLAWHQRGGLVAMRELMLARAPLRGLPPPPLPHWPCRTARSGPFGSTPSGWAAMVSNVRP